MALIARRQTSHLLLWLCCALPGLTLAAGAAPASVADAYLRYAGTAQVRHSSQFLYGERHVLHYRGGQLSERVVLYTCSDGSAFARKTVSYVDPLAPDFVLEDSGNGLREGIRSGLDGRVVFFRPHPSDAEQSGPLPRVMGLVADAGFDEFVRSNWQRLIEGEALQMPFLVPSRLEDFGFQVQHLRSETLAGTPTEVFRLRLSGFWGWFLRGIDVYYSSAAHVLVHYDGLSDLRDPAGDPFKAEIDFPGAARGPASEQDLLAAREAPLHPCR
ncbi:MAG TPA: hypothetical protein VN859_04475 [Steroidobacteraceae bacterium]|nr:hypothetical protein [Steroidobacteraceae bacterium]